MIFLFYVFGCVSIASAICMIVSTHPIYALLYLTVLLLSISGNLFFLKAPFAGFIEITVYAGAIMVLFLFVIMMLDMKNTTIDNIQCKKYVFLSFKSVCSILLIIISLLGILLNSIFELRDNFININESIISIKQIGIILFGPYILIVEMVSMLLLAALISVLHISYQPNKSFDYSAVLQVNNKK